MPKLPQRLPGPDPRPAPFPALPAVLTLVLALAVSRGAGDDPDGVPAGTFPITLETAIRLADERNAQLAAQLERETRAALAADAAWLGWLPTVRAGASLLQQDGALQDTLGRVADIRRDGRYLGFGGAVIGAGPPLLPGATVEIDAARALFEPLAARQTARAAGAASEATRARVLLQVAVAYYELLRRHHAVTLTLEARRHAEDLASATGEFAASGEGLVADAERAAVESLLLAEEVEAARGDRAAAAAELGRLLRLDESVRLEPADGVVLPIEGIGASRLSEEECIARALVSRPEVREQEALVEAARAALKARTFGPLLPKLQAFYNYGDFEGGSPSVNGERHDAGVAVYWQVRGLGLVDRNERRQQASRVRETELQGDQIVSEIVAEVRRAHADLHAALRRMSITTTAVERARKAHLLNRDRIFQKEGLPLESLQAMQALARAEQLHLRAITDHNLAQLRLLVATGGNPADPSGAGDQPTEP